MAYPPPGAAFILSLGPGVDFLFGDGVCLRIRAVIGIGRIGIDRGLIFAAFVKEVERECRAVAVLVGGAADKPVVGAFGLARGDDITSRLGLRR